MKPITRDDCELMCVWDGELPPPKTNKSKWLVVNVFPDGSCVAINPTAAFKAESITYFGHCAPIEKIKAPLESTDVIPAWCVFGSLLPAQSFNHCSITGVKNNHVSTADGCLSLGQLAEGGYYILSNNRRFNLYREIEE